MQPSTGLHFLIYTRHRTALPTIHPGTGLQRISLPNLHPGTGLHLFEHVLPKLYWGH